ncbi:MAG: hypothetical protein EXS33_04700 [Pedosphaera sp.]|nr:hypothetical protein [Pedosphaera sp.]
MADKKLERFILNDGDILISLTGNIGRVGIIQEDQLSAVLNQRVARLTIKDRGDPASNPCASPSPLHKTTASTFLETC